MRYRVLPYRQGSKGAAALAAALGGRVLRLEGSTFVPRDDDVVVNWGNSNRIAGVGVPYVNHPDLITQASNKRSFFKLMQENNSDVIPKFWTSPEDIPDEAFPVVCRTVLAGHSGDGIVIAATRDGVVPAPLYVQYVKKSQEYRIHVGRRSEAIQTIAVQRKARRTDHPAENVNWQVRNHANGFVYVRGGFTAPSSVIEAAERALLATGLDFGAVDVIYNEAQGKAYVLEINTAPGLEGQTVQDYANFFKGLTT